MSIYKQKITKLPKMSPNYKLEKQARLIEMLSNRSELHTKSIQGGVHGEMGKVEALRKENDKLRKELGQSINQKLKLLTSISQQHSIILNDQHAITHILSPTFITSLLSLFQQLHNLHQYSKSIQCIQEKEKINEKNNKKRQEIEKMKERLREKEQELGRLVERVNEKVREYERVQEEVEGAVEEYNGLRRKLVQKRWRDNSIQQLITTHLTHNFQPQTTTLTHLIQQRSYLRNQLSLLNSANHLLNSKIITRHNQFQQSLQRNVKIEQVKRKNQELRVKLEEEKKRRERLEEMREGYVHEMSVRMAERVAERWEGERRGCENVLLRIIERVNQKLPFRKLDDVTEIIKAAENFIEPQSESHQINNHPSMAQENDHQQQI